MNNLPPVLIWAPVSNYHDPNPPFPLLDEGTQPGVGLAEGDSVANGVAAIVIEAVGLAEGDSFATAVGSDGNAGVGLATADSVATGVAETPTEGIGLAEGDSVAAAVGEDGNASAGLAEGDSTATGVSAQVLTGAGLAIGDSEATGQSGHVGLAQGDSTATGVSAFSSVATVIFTYTAADPTLATFVPRRRPMLNVNRQVDSGLNTFDYDTHEAEPLTGQHIVADLGEGAFFHGPIVRVDTNYEGLRSQLVWHATAVDYTFHLNRRRPFGCFDNVKVTDIVEGLMDDYTEGFTYVVEQGLPYISIDFDGSQTMTEALTMLAEMIGGHWRLDIKVLHFFTEDLDPQPDDIDDANMSLLRDPQIVVTRDISQIRTRVYGRGAEATVAAPVAPGDTSILVEVNDPDAFEGNQALVAGQVVGFPSAEVITTIIPRWSGPPIGAMSAALIAIPKVVEGEATTFNYPYYVPNVGGLESSAYETGPIKCNVRYFVSFVGKTWDGISVGESELSAPSNSVLNGSASPFIQNGLNDQNGLLAIVGSGGATPWTYAFMWRMRDGQLSNISSLSTSGGQAVASLYFPLGVKVFMGAAGIPNITFSNIPVTGFPNVDGISIYREKSGSTQLWLVAQLGNGTTAFTDTAADADLLIRAPAGISQRVGATIALVNIPVGPDDPVNGIVTTGRRIYRQENVAVGSGLGPNAGPTPLLLATLDDNTTTEWIDEKPCGLGATPTCPGEDGLPVFPVQAPGSPSLEPQAQTKTFVRLTGIPASGAGAGSVQCDIQVGDKIYPWVQVDDLQAQIALAATEGGDGVHEYVIFDSSLTTREGLIRRCEAELALFSRPIVTVVYATRDVKTKPGKTVVFNLSDPPIVETLKIQDVTVDQIHEGTGLVERYTATASSVRFTLQDLLRRVLLRSGR